MTTTTTADADVHSIASDVRTIKRIVVFFFVLWLVSLIFGIVVLLSLGDESVPGVNVSNFEFDTTETTNP